MTKPFPFKFSSVDVNGEPVADSGWMGNLGMAAKYSGTTEPNDPLIQAFAAAYEGQDLSVEQQDLLRSLVVNWLESRKKKLGAVVEAATTLPPAVEYIARIGMIDRGIVTVATGVAVIGVAFLQFEVMWDSVLSQTSDLSTSPTLFGAPTQVSTELAMAGLEVAFFSKLVRNYGRPGEPVKRSNFDHTTVFSFLKLCRFRSLVARTGLTKPLADQMLARLDDRIFLLFLANSRQLEGLKLNGKSEAAAVVAAHAAIALSFQDNQPEERDAIFTALKSRITSLEKRRKGDQTNQADEAAATLATIQENLSKELWQMELALNRQLHGATASEAVGLVAAPVSTAFDVLAYVATGVGKCCSGGSSKAVFEVAATGLKTASAAADATPDAIASTVSGAANAESWVRSMFDKAWSTVRS